MTYDPRVYWNGVADEIAHRTSGPKLAGYDSPLDRYTRAQVATRLREIDVRRKDVMEVGSGSGLNLRLLDEGQPRSITAIDVSERMLALAKEAMREARSPTTFVHIDGCNIPLPDSTVDYAFTVTVLQHNTDVTNLRRLAAEMARVVRSRIYLFEDTAPSERGTTEYMLRPISFYEALFEPHGFQLSHSHVASMFFTQRLFSLFNRMTGLYRMNEGGAAPSLMRWIQYPFFPMTVGLDRLIKRREGNTLMVFDRRPR